MSKGKILLHFYLDSIVKTYLEMLIFGDNIAVYPKVSVILNAVKDLALGLLHILCEILRVAQKRSSLAEGKSNDNIAVFNCNG